MMVGETSRWVSYHEAADQLGLSPDAAKRMALRRGWPRRAGAAGEAQVAIPAAWAGEDDDGDDVVRAVRGCRHVLVAYLETRVEELTEALAEAHTEMRGVRYEAESLRIDAARAQVFSALVDAERARSAELKAERDRLAEELLTTRWISVGGLVRALTGLGRAGHARRQGPATSVG